MHGLRQCWYFWKNFLCILREGGARILESVLALLSGVRPRSLETCAQMMLHSFLSRSHLEFGRFSTSPEYLTVLYAVQVLLEELVSRHYGGEGVAGTPGV